MEWTDANAYVAEVMKVRDAVLASWWTIVRRVRDARRITVEEVYACEPHVEVTVRDHRTDKRDAIPDLAEAARPAWATPSD